MSKIKAVCLDHMPLLPKAKAMRRLTRNFLLTRLATYFAPWRLPLEVTAPNCYR